MTDGRNSHMMSRYNGPRAEAPGTDEASRLGLASQAHAFVLPLAGLLLSLLLLLTGP